LVAFATECLQGWTKAEAFHRLRSPGPSRPHGLTSELIVSLTSYPARFGTLHFALSCLLDQSVKADRTILWVAHKDEDHPPAVRELEQRGLEIRACDDLRSLSSHAELLTALRRLGRAGGIL
jgi:hypothetical protein